ncbi:unnamed protein product [Ectocarpus sp. 12 AP-2014]
MSLKKNPTLFCFLMHKTHNWQQNRPESSTFFDLKLPNCQTLRFPRLVTTGSNDQARHQRAPSIICGKNRPLPQSSVLSPHTYMSLKISSLYSMRPGYHRCWYKLVCNVLAKITNTKTPATQDRGSTCQ